MPEASTGNLATQRNFSLLNFLKAVSRVLLVGATMASLAICCSTCRSSTKVCPTQGSSKNSYRFGLLSTCSSWHFPFPRFINRVTKEFDGQGDCGSSTDTGFDPCHVDVGRLLFQWWWHLPSCNPPRRAQWSTERGSRYLSSPGVFIARKPYDMLMQQHHKMIIPTKVGSAKRAQRRNCWGKGSPKLKPRLPSIHNSASRNEASKTPPPINI